MAMPHSKNDRPEKLDTARDKTPYDGGSTDTESGAGAGAGAGAGPQGAPIDVPKSAIDMLKQPQVRPLASHRQGPKAAGETGEGNEPLVDGGSGSGASEPGGNAGG